jgi:hypothetical protein
MVLDLALIHPWIQNELTARRPVAEAMDRLIDRCERRRPHPDWADFRRLPFGDLFPVLEWLQRPFRDEPAGKMLRGLWFGLCNPYNEVGEVVADIYVCGSTRFDPNPRSNEWAVGPDWLPDSRYAGSAVLANVYRIADRPKGLGNEAEYPICLGYAAFAVREMLNSLPPALILRDSASLGVAVGFESGDFVLLGEYGPGGFAQ